MNINSRDSISLLRRCIVFAILLSTTMTVLMLPQSSGSHIPNPVIRDGWTVYWEVTADDGLAVSNVEYGGTMVLRDGRLAGVVVRYLGGGCFFYDEIGYDPPDPYPETLNHGNVSIVYPITGGFNLTADANVPGYDYKQTWVFYPDGRFMALLKIVGGGCNDIHTYSARWRLDFAIAGDNADTVHAYTNTGWASARAETEIVDSGLRDPSNSFTAWKVSDRTRSYHLVPFDLPEATALPSRLLVVASRPGEIENSHSPGIVSPNVYLDGERAFRNNVALWYISEHTHNIHREVVFEEPVLTGLIFYPGGF